MAYTKAHSAISWHNTPSTASPLNETNLNKMDNEIGVIDDRVVEMSGQMPKKTDFKESNTIEPSVDLTGNVSFNVKDGSLTDAMLSGDPVGHAQQYANQAQASATNAALSATNAAASEIASENYYSMIEDAIDTNIPSFTLDPLTGHLSYTGGTINFTLNTNKHLLWEVQV